MAEIYAFPTSCTFSVVYFGVPRNFVSRDFFVLVFRHISTLKYCVGHRKSNSQKRRKKFEGYLERPSCFIKQTASLNSRSSTTRRLSMWQPAEFQFSGFLLADDFAVGAL
jgi:hypothetical protein